MVLEVALPIPLRRNFDYCLPVTIGPNQINIGARVKVPFGRRTLIGIVVAIKQHSLLPSQQLKAIIAILDNDSLFSPLLLNLLRWSSDYYQYALGEVLHAALPTLLRRGAAATLPVTVNWQLSAAAAALPVEQFNRAPRQRALFKLLQQYPQGITAELLKQQAISPVAVKIFLTAGWVTTHQNNTETPTPAALAQTALILNPAQQRAVQQIVAALSKFQTFLLDGITGSGKTEVYLQALASVFEQGKQALVLVPEIALTPQTLARFQSRFAVGIAVYHSTVTESERLQIWLKSQSGQVRLVVATRSGIFLPFKNLGLIVVDEEHDLSFKQQEGLRYSARDLAVRRAQLENIPIVLGTATPSLESFYNVTLARYQALHLPLRAGSALLPSLHILDMRKQNLSAGMTPHLLQAITSTLAAKNQVLLFLNRRGYATVYLCHGCGWIANCQRCDAYMTLHQHPRRLHCHHCNHHQPVVQACPDCHSQQLMTLGVGTQQLEKQLQSLFPSAKLVRIDRDSTRRKGTLEQHLDSIHNGDKDILIGTQMLAKGHHFPRVTLVGILNADNGLFSTDFRALEHTAQLLIQVAGRAGRAEQAGQVFIQTHHPQHRLLQELIHHGYSVFAQNLLLERQQANLPPFSYLALLRAESKQLELAQQFLGMARDYAHANNAAQLDILGPVSAPMEKRAGYHRSQLLFRSPQRSPLQKLLKQLCIELENHPATKKVRWSIDVDPQEMA